MVDCFDRIHLKLTEVVLRPLQALHAQPELTSATVRLPGRGCRIDLTVTKHASPGPKPSSFYRWSARGIDRAGTRSWQSDDQFESPEAAFWSAVDLIGSSMRRMASA